MVTVMDSDLEQGSSLKLICTIHTFDKMNLSPQGWKLIILWLGKRSAVIHDLHLMVIKVIEGKGINM